MMFGYSDEWWALLFVPVVLWVPFGPFVMGAVGVWCARRPGSWPRLWSVLLPLVPVAVSASVIILPTDRWDDPTWHEDVLGYVLVYVLGITVLPWVLGYGITRVVRGARGARARRVRDRGRERERERERDRGRGRGRGREREREREQDRGEGEGEDRGEGEGQERVRGDGQGRTES